MKTIVLQLAGQTRQNLEILASATGRNASELVAEAVEEYVEREMSLLIESHRREEEYSSVRPGVPRLGRKKI